MNTKKLKWAEALVAIVCGFDGWSRNFFGEWNSRLGHKGLTCSLLVQLKTLNRVTTQNSLGPSLVCLVCLVRLSAVPEQNKSRNLWLHFHQSHRTNSLIYKEKEKCIISLKLPRPGVAIAEDLSVFSNCDKDIHNIQRKHKPCTFPFINHDKIINACLNISKYCKYWCIHQFKNWRTLIFTLFCFPPLVGDDKIKCCRGGASNCGTELLINWSEKVARHRGKISVTQHLQI